jgi:DNA adenine methylase
MGGAPFLKWAGGKRWLVPQIIELISPLPKRYIEPFLGSGAVFFALEPRRALLADTNQWLIETYCAVRDVPEKVLSALSRHQRLHSKTHYYDTRAARPRSAHGRAAQLIYLNRTCWNALFRVNRSGVFNVPKGTKNSVLLPTDNFANWSRALKRSRIVVGDFERALSRCGAGDFVFADPPYVTTHVTNGFIKYNEELFTWKDQQRLALAAHAAAVRGATVVVTNSAHKSVRDLYRPYQAKLKILDRRSIIAAKSEHRRSVREMLIILNGHSGVSDVV